MEALAEARAETRVCHNRPGENATPAAAGPPPTRSHLQRSTPTLVMDAGCG